MPPTLANASAFLIFHNNNSSSFCKQTEAASYTLLSSHISYKSMIQFSFVAGNQNKICALWILKRWQSFDALSCFFGILFNCHVWSLVEYYEPTHKKSLITFQSYSIKQRCRAGIALIVYFNSLCYIFAPFKILADAAKLWSWFVLAAVKCVI